MPSFWPGGRRGVLTTAATACATTSLALLAATLAGAGQQTPPSAPDSARSAGPVTRHTPEPDASALPRSEPVEIKIPKIDLKTRVDKVTTSTDGSVAMPTDADDAGWYTGSPTPGENGNTIVVGHIDSSTGPAAFYNLGDVRKGDHINISRRDGSTASFDVTSMNIWPQDTFPSQRVYAPTRDPQLTLITCADWDESTGTYQSNLVITAHPSLPRAKP